MSDKLIKFLSHVDMVKIAVIDSTELVEKARKLHGLNPTPTAALGRLLTMAALMGAGLKNEEDKLTLQILGDGPVGSILAVSGFGAKVKGYLSEPLAEAESTHEGKLNVGAIVGKGDLRVIKDIGLKDPYIGVVPLQTGEIAEDFAYYFAYSEQIPSAVALGVLVNQDGSVKKAGGYLLQIMPDTPEQIIKLIEDRLASSKSITQMLEDNMSLEEIATYISDDLNTRAVEELVPEYKCDCSRERMEKALISLGKTELENLLQDEKTELQCHFCNKKYVFTRSEIEKIMENAKA
ncbi:MAG: Hsp33 family molecular chaperone HslO [Clostridia bacterium]|nr:Hsp33 family molecular chaperone HslO [Clostridia bacterium]